MKLLLESSALRLKRPRLLSRLLPASGRSGSQAAFFLLLADFFKVLNSSDSSLFKYSMTSMSSLAAFVARTAALRDADFRPELLLIQTKFATNVSGFGLVGGFRAVHVDPFVWLASVINSRF
ncbi:MAG: hypothetical protein IPJ48_19120 [Propionivibrio sp.]|uniref:Uncharacterized protein n=1 Tax=Candidatus Propionivibrio dominans TaxID=2954373 RepID=A0A9D7IAB6_9RHOO|nr:hypothetical protein [Candidatus Propionivibrio dominans]